MFYFYKFLIFLLFCIITGCSVGSNPLPVGLTLDPTLSIPKPPSQLAIRNLQYRKFNKSSYELIDAVDEMHKTQSIIDSCKISLPKFKVYDGVSHTSSKNIISVENIEPGISQKCKFQINGKNYFVAYEIKPFNKYLQFNDKDNNDIYWMRGQSRTSKINLEPSLVRIQLYNTDYQLFDEYLYSYVFKKLADISFSNSLVLDPSTIE